VDGGGRHSELDLMASAGREVEFVPRQRLAVKAPRQSPQPQPAEHRDQADVDGDDAQVAVLARQLHVADSGDALLVQIHNLVIDHVSRQAELAWTSLGRTGIGGAWPKRHLGSLEGRHVVPRNSSDAPPDLRQQRRYGRERLVEPHREIVQPADPLAAGIDHVLAEMVG
jgi:hypothetical protein